MISVPGSTKYQKKKSFYQKSGKAGQPGKIYQFRGKFYQQKFQPKNQSNFTIFFVKFDETKKPVFCVLN